VWVWKGWGLKRRHIIQTAMGSNSTNCNALGNEKMVLTCSLSFSLLYALRLKMSKKSIRFLAKSGRREKLESYVKRMFDRSQLVDVSNVLM